MLTLSGCTVGPDFMTPAAPDAPLLPGRGADGGGVLSRRLTPGADIAGTWWQLFGSRKLGDLVEQGLAYNADLEAAGAALQVAQANALAQRGAFWPTIQANWNSSRQKVPTRSLASNAANDASIYSLHTAQLTIAYTLDVWGGTRRQVEALESQIESQFFQREAVALTLSSNIVQAAIQEASLRGQIAVTKRQIELQSALLEILRRQQTVGQIALPDVLVQETALAQARLLLPPLERQLDQQRHLLSVLTGRLPGQGVDARFELDSFKVPRQLPVSLPADVVRQRPDIRAAEANLRGSNAQIGVAIANRLPQITLNGNAGSTANAISQLFSPGTWFWMIAGNAVQTVFDGRTLAYRQEAAEAAFRQATAQYRGVVLTAFQNVADTLRALEADEQMVQAAAAAEQAAQRSLSIIRSQLEQGQVSLPALLAAQQASLQTSLAVVQAKASRLNDIVALFQSLGGGWWNRVEAPVAGRVEEVAHR